MAQRGRTSPRFWKVQDYGGALCAQARVSLSLHRLTFGSARHPCSGPRPSNPSLPLLWGLPAFPDFCPLRCASLLFRMSLVHPRHTPSGTPGHPKRQLTCAQTQTLTSLGWGLHSPPSPTTGLMKMIIACFVAFLGVTNWLILGRPFEDEEPVLLMGLKTCTCPSRGLSQQRMTSHLPLGG